jgi:hypothetical protein
MHLLNSLAPERNDALIPRAKTRLSLASCWLLEGYFVVPNLALQVLSSYSRNSNCHLH